MAVNMKETNNWVKITCFTCWWFTAERALKIYNTTRAAPAGLLVPTSYWKGLTTRQPRQILFHHPISYLEETRFFHFRGAIFLAFQQPLGCTVAQQKFLVFFPKYFPDPLNQMFLRKTTITTSWNYFITRSLIHVVLPKPATRHLGSTKTSAAFCFSWILLYIYN